MKTNKGKENGDKPPKVTKGVPVDVARYIPKPLTDVNAHHELMMAPSTTNNTNNINNNMNSASDLISQAVCPALIENNCVLSFSKHLPESNEAGTANAVKFQQNNKNMHVEPAWKVRRFIPKTSERTLDAPGLRNDFYMNLVDWGGRNTIAVGLDCEIYLWNASSGKVELLKDPRAASADESAVCCLKWSGTDDSSCLASSRENGAVQLWDARANRLLRTLKEHPMSRISCLSWNRFILSAGGDAGEIYNYDVRMHKGLLCTISTNSTNNNSTTQRVCSLSWSPDCRHLACGSNDNRVLVYSLNDLNTNNHELTPVHELVAHRAAVKALSWHTRESNLLATGGGMADGLINMWDVYSGRNVGSIPTGSQVTGLIWSSFYNEIVSAHGNPFNRLAIWAYPSMACIAQQTGHSQRILCICLSPDGTTVASVGGDETLRLFKTFDVEVKKQGKHSFHAVSESRFIR